ncbi:TPM domain-containing protein [bacterium]|nr:TPM domain-containing protein [bacterium]
MKHQFTDEDRARIEQAVADAETKTSGEIVPVCVASCDAYGHADLSGGIVGAIIAFVAFMWIAPEASYVGLALAQVAGFLAGYFVTRRVPVVKRFFVGERVMEVEVRQRAFEAFAENGVSETKDRTGVLILVTLLERRIVVLADKGINATVEPGLWNEVVVDAIEHVKSGSVTDGVVHAIHKVGDHLGKHFPRAAGDVNELPDALRTE